MKPSFKPILSLMVGILITLFFLSLAFKNVPLHDLRHYFSTIDYLGLIPPLLLVVLTFGVRSIRWYLLLEKRLPLPRCYHYLISGFMLNCILPARMGEIARPLLAGREPGCNVPTAISSIVMERLFDMLTLILLFYGLIHFISISDDLTYKMGQYHLNKTLLMDLIGSTLTLAIMLFCIMGLMAYHRSRRFLLFLLNKIDAKFQNAMPREATTSNRVVKASQTLFRYITIFIEKFAAGTQSINSFQTCCTVFLLSMLIWMLLGGSYLLVARAVPGIPLNFFEATFTMIIICFFIALPSAPGFWGVWEAGGIFAMMIFGMEGSDVLGYHLINHVVQLAPVMVMGFISAWMIGFSKLIHTSTHKMETK